MRYVLRADLGFVGEAKRLDRLRLKDGPGTSSLSAVGPVRAFFVEGERFAAFAPPPPLVLAFPLSAVEALGSGATPSGSPSPAS